MWLQLLQAQGLRSFQQCELTFAPGINVLFGDNGVGKTSILEGINVLSCGKSFRSNRISNIINLDSAELILFGEILTAEQDSIQLGVKINSSSTELRINREKVKKWSELAKNLPSLEIHPESYLLITGGPIERRKFLNWGMFHVEPSYSQIWSDYSRALKQRSICLKSRNIKQARFWHQSLSQNGEMIAEFLTQYSNDLIPYISELAAQFGIADSIELDYSPGWDRTYSLEEMLDLELQSKDMPVSTLNGPHRGDLKIRWNNKSFSKISSRGQQKVLAIALKLAQAQLLKARSGKSSIYLIDELPAELDSIRRQVALDILGKLDSQIIISTVSRDSVSSINADIKWFHVKHSSVSAML